MVTASKASYRLYRLASAIRHRLRRRLTRPGLAVLGGLLVMAAMGLDTERSVAYQAFALLLCLLLVAAASTVGWRARFSVRRSLPRVGTVGCPLTYSVSLHNPTARVQEGLVLFEDLADPRPTFEEYLARQPTAKPRLRWFRTARSPAGGGAGPAEAGEIPVPPLPPRESVPVPVRLTPRRRGRLDFAGVTLARPEPLGLVRSLKTVRARGSVLVLPRRYPVPPIALPGHRKYQAGGVALACSVGESGEYVALRDYRRGDPLRHLHWRSWAKTGRPIVKEHQDEFFVRHALILDTFSGQAGSEVFEEAVSVAASFACTVQTQESLLDLLFVGPEAYCFTVGRGVAHTEQMLEVLAAVRLCRAKPFAALEHLVLNHADAVSGCVCVLLAWDAARRQLVRRLRALGVPLLVLVIVEPGGKEPLEGGSGEGRPENFHVLEVGAVPEGLARL